MSTFSSQDWNPRYLQYCRAHGYDPQNCPDKSNAEFIIWSRQQLVKARAAHPEFFMGHGLVNHDGYDGWMEKSVDQSLAAMEGMER